MGFDPRRGRGPRLDWLRSRRRSPAAGQTWYSRFGAEQYARAGMVLALVVLVVALVAIFAGRGGSARHAATPTALARRASATGIATRAAVPASGANPGGAGGNAGDTGSSDAVTIRGMLLPGQDTSGNGGSTAPRALIDSKVLVAVEGGRCSPIYDAQLKPGDGFAIQLPNGCAPAGSRVYFEAAGTDPITGNASQQPLCVTSGDHPQSYLIWTSSAGPSPDIDVRLTPGCADVPAALVFLASQPAADQLGRDFLVRLESGFPGGVRSEEQAQLLAGMPGFPGGVQTETPVGVATPPLPPSIAGGPPGVQQPSDVGAAPANSTPAPFVQSPPVTNTQPPVAFSPPPPPAPPPAPPPVVTAPPVVEPPTPSLPAPGVVTPTPAAGDAMLLTVTVLTAQGTTLSEPRVQAFSGASLCADESAAGTSQATIALSLPGMCQNLQTGAPLSFKAGGNDPAGGPVDPPRGACSTAPGQSSTYAPVSFQPGQQQVTLVLTDTQPLAGCPGAAAPGVNAGTMQISVAVRANDSDELFSSPSVRVYVGAKQCSEASSEGALVVHATLPADCGKPGDLLTFEAGGQDPRKDQPTPLTPACPYELVFGGRADPSPAYAPVTFVPGERFVPLILSALPGCPLPGAAPAQPSDAGMTLTLTIVDPARPDVPYARPSITALVGGVACVRGESLESPAVVLTLPKGCGTAGAAVTFLVSALDPRFSRSGQIAACAVDPPPSGQAARTYHPTAKTVTFQPGQSATYGLMSSDAACQGAATPSPTPGTAPTATPSLSATPGPTPAAGSGSRTATAVASATPSPSPTPSPPPPGVLVQPPERIQ